MFRRALSKPYTVLRLACVPGKRLMCASGEDGECDTEDEEGFHDADVGDVHADDM